MQTNGMQYKSLIIEKINNTFIKGRLHERHSHRHSTKYHLT